ncbi:MAG: RIP metalloprotease RseP [Muribaculaceae bacterium]|nr:RIP metalloprotease RseP [Muribaculaceae bacterium]
MNFIDNLIEIFGSASFWVKALEMILALSLLVIVHEFGHYSFARLFGMRVNKFYMFFNPKFSILRWDPKRHTLDLFKRNPSDEEEEAKAKAEAHDLKASWRDTVYGIGWIPLGGYCSIAGMVDETTSADQLSEEAQPWEFRSRPAWQRLLVMIGGVLFNFLMAVVIYAGIVWSYGEMFINFTDATEGMNYCQTMHKVGFRDGDILYSADGKALTYYSGEQITAVTMAKQVQVLRGGDTVTINMPENFVFELNKEAEQGNQLFEIRMPVVIAHTQSNMGAEKAGLKSGDRILAVNTDTTPSYTELTPALLKYKGSTATITYLRDGRQLTTRAEIDGDGKLGIQLTDPTKIFKTTVKHYNIFQSVPRGIEMGWNKLVTYVQSLKLVATPEGAKSLGGFGAIGSIFPEKWNWLDFWSITAFLSVILAVMNILPIPILDGGYVLFLLIEMITGWKPSEKVMNIALNIGLALLIILMLYANLNDVYRFIIK